MMNPHADTPSARVYFVEGATRLRLGKSLRWNWHALGTLVIALLSRSKLTHLAIGLGDAVFVPSQYGGSTWDCGAFERRYPRLRGHIDVPITPIFRLDDDSRPYRLLAFLVHWLTGGLYAPHTCVGDVKAVLAAGGVHVPRRVVTPEQLRRFLIGRGCCWQALRDSRPADSGVAAGVL